ncbi:MAG: exported protein of unknown function [Mycetocola sp.]|jgi:hypothetical protein|nr:exported protein of unknown function [Mycetocola sp.]
MIRSATGSLLTLLAAAVRLVASVVGGLILLYAVFVFFEANPANPLVEFTGGVRRSLGGFTEGLFNPSDPKIAGTVNAVLAAFVWVVGGNLASKAITRLAPRATSKA